MEATHPRERGSVPGEDRQQYEINELLVSHDDLSSYENRIVVAGSRSYNNYDEFDWMLHILLQGMDKSNCVIISGVARDGPDAMAIRWCKQYQWKYAEFPADWNQFKKAAGYIRNVAMKKVATRVIVFWDLISKGSRHMFTISNEDKSIQTSLVVVFADGSH